MGWLKRLFGHGKVRIEFEVIDRNGNTRVGTAKTEYEGEYDEQAVIDRLRKEIAVEHGVQLVKAEVVQHIEY